MKRVRFISLMFIPFTLFAANTVEVERLNSCKEHSGDHYPEESVAQLKERAKLCASDQSAIQNVVDHACSQRHQLPDDRKYEKSSYKIFAMECKQFTYTNVTPGFQGNGVECKVPITVQCVAQP
jgi:hypothetical protein